MITSLASGALPRALGWIGVNLLFLPFLLTRGIALIVYLLRRTRAESAAIREA